MREIVFRGKRFNGKWVEGGIFIQKEDEVKYFAVYIVTPSLAAKCNMYEVPPETVGQYTGLKDKNGKRIFEGDIFDWGYAGEKTLRYVVVYDAGLAAFVGKRRFGFVTLNGIDFEIIGNIHDNPELMEVQ